MLSEILAAAAVFFLAPLQASAYSFNFTSTPAQCQNISIQISGSGTPPYRVLILPFGASPLPNNIEARRIVDQPFEGNSNSLSFQLKYPANSQFVAVVSDSSAFGSGGTSVAAQVLTNSDATCFDANTNVSPQFVFNLDPANQIVQCSPSRIWWDSSTVQGIPSFLGVIPGGQSFSVPQSSLTNVSNEGTGFSWTPSVRAGTTLLLVGGDNRGAGSAGSVLNTVSAGTNPSNDCLNGSSPSSTPGSPAGGSYPTSASGAGTGGGGSGGNGQGKSSTNVGAIVGGVVGGVSFFIAFLLVLLFFHRRRRHHAQQKERPVDLLQGGEEDDEGDTALHGGSASRNNLPQYYQPEPFLVPDPTLASRSSHDGDTTHADDAGRPLSGVTSTSRSGTPDMLGFGLPGGSTTSGGRKGAMRPLRPVNIIQHDDAGPSSEPKEEEAEPETIELPPAYTNIRK